MGAVCVRVCVCVRSAAHCTVKREVDCTRIRGSASSRGATPSVVWHRFARACACECEAYQLLSTVGLHKTERLTHTVYSVMH